MTRKVQVTPGNLIIVQARIGAVVASAFLLFGATFAFFVLRDMDDSEGGMRVLIAMFFFIWTVVCGSMIVFFVRLGSNRRDNSIVELRLDDSDEPPHRRSDNQA